MDPLSSEEVLHEEHRHEERMVRESSKRNDYFLGVSILLAAVMIGGALIYSTGLHAGNPNGDTTPPPAGTQQGGDATPAILATDVILGNPNAPVTLFEFADYQCPFCAKFHVESSPQIRDNYIKSGKVKMVYRDFTFLGPESIEAAKAARCAQDQGKFWEYHDALYDVEHKDAQENSGNLTKALFLQLAGNLKLNTSQFTSCLDTNKYADFVEKERTDAANYGVNSTPTLFVNGTKIVGAQPYSVFQAAFDSVLKKQ
jgi:protein-disulfide isomerase